MIEQIALGIGIFVLCLIGLFYFIPMNVGAWQYWVSIFVWIKRVRAAKRKNSIGE